MRKRNVATKLIVLLIIGIGICGFSKAVEENSIEYSVKPYSEKYLEWLELPEDVREKTIAPAKFIKEIESNPKELYKTSNFRILKASTKYASKYDPRETLKLTIKNQGHKQLCWAMGTMTTLEAYMKKVENKSVEYSAKHVEYATSKTFLNGTNVNGYNRELDSGGNAIIAYSYMASGRGPILEKDMPFDGNLEKVNLSEIEGKTVQAQLEQYVIFPHVFKEKSQNKIIYTNGQTDENRKVYTDTEIEEFRNQIKEHILKYGAVTAQVNASGTKFYNKTDTLQSTSYYCDDNEALIDHQVTIIGWDDEYAVTNFNENHRPTKPGAYLVQNSYGKEVNLSAGGKSNVFDNGYIYISYEDFMIETAMTGIKKVSNVDYDNIYEYDPLGCSQELTTNVDKVAGANVFTRKTDKVEVLNEISFYPLEGCTYEIYVNGKNGELDQIEKVGEIGEIKDAYYTTVKLEKPILLTGSKFVVAVRYISKDTANLPIECVVGYDENNIYSTATSNAGESFVCAGNTLETWGDMKDISIYEVNNISFCLKAFTSELDETKLYSDVYDIGENIITKIPPSTTLKTFKSNIITNADVGVYDTKGKKLEDNNFVTTDSALKLLNSDLEYKLIVIADLNGDGKATPTDLLKLKKHVVKLETLLKNFAMAADINFDGNVTPTDLLQIKKIIVGLIKL